MFDYGEFLSLTIMLIFIYVVPGKYGPLSYHINFTSFIGGITIFCSITYLILNPIVEYKHKNDIVSKLTNSDYIIEFNKDCNWLYGNLDCNKDSLKIYNVKYNQINSTLRQLQSDLTTKHYSGMLGRTVQYRLIWPFGSFHIDSTEIYDKLEDTKYIFFIEKGYYDDNRNKPFYYVIKFKEN